MRVIIFFILGLVSVQAIWKPTLRGNNRLRALDKSKMLDVKIKGHGYFKYIIPTSDTSKENTPTKTPILCSIRDLSTDGGPQLYIPSSGFTLGDSTDANSYHNGGFKWSNSGNKIHINLERNDAIPVSNSLDPPAGSVEYWNGDRSVASSDMLDGNWIDPEVYVLKINTEGNMRLYTHGSDSPGYVTESDTQWTITGWGQTVLRGTIEETTKNGVTTTKLVVKNSVYRQFSADLKVNPQENFLGIMYTEVESYETNVAAASITAGTVFTVNKKTSTPCKDFKVVYNRYGRFHINKEGRLADMNGALVLGYTPDGKSESVINLDNTWDRVIISNTGVVKTMHDYGLKTAGIIKLARFTNENGLGIFQNTPVKTQCSGENSLGFVLGNWCAGTDLDGLDTWYYEKSASSGDAVEGTPFLNGLGSTLQYSLSTKESDLYIGGTAPTV